MAYSRKCDNCGKFFEPNKSEKDNRILFMYITEDYSYDEDGESIDLCPECIDAVWEALNKRKNMPDVKEVYEPPKPKLTKEELEFVEELKDIYPNLDSFRKCEIAGKPGRHWVIELVFCMGNVSKYPILIPIDSLNPNIRFDFLDRWDMVAVEELLKLEVEE